MKWVSRSYLVIVEGWYPSMVNWYSSPTSLDRALLRPHPVVPASWSLDLLTVRMARFLLQEINSVKGISWRGRGKGKSYHKIVFPRSENFL